MLRNTLLCYALPCLCYELLCSALLLHAMLGYALLPSFHASGRLLDRCEGVALLVRFTTFACIAALLLLAADATTSLAFMGTVFCINAYYMFYVLLHIASEVPELVEQDALCRNVVSYAKARFAP